VHMSTPGWRVLQATVLMRISHTLPSKTYVNFLPTLHNAAFHLITLPSAVSVSPNV